MAERVAIIVIGMHRSGSSAMARLLSLAGAALPICLMTEGRGNETGHWEPQRVADYNDTVLAAFDGVWDSPFGLGMNAGRRTALEPFVEGARGIIRDEYPDAPLIVLKEPRISLVADLWVNALEAEGFRCKFVIMVRPPTEVASSLRKRDGFTLDKGLLLWGVYQASSELLTRSHDRVFCRYDDLLARPASILDDVEAKLRIELPRRTAQAHAEMDAFVRPALKRNDVATIPDIPDHLRPIADMSDYVYAAMVGETPNIDVSRDLQKWFSDLDQTMTPLMIGIARHLQAERENAVALVQGQVDANRAEIERVNALYCEQMANVARLNAQFNESEDLRHDAERRSSEADEARQATQAHLAGRDAEIAALRGALDAANGALSELSATLESRTAELAESSADNDAKTAQIRVLADAGAQLELAHAEAQAALTAQSADNAQSRIEADAAREAWRAREAELEAALSGVRAAQEDLAGRHEHVLATLADERVAAVVRETALVEEAAVLRDAAERADEATASLREALAQTQGDAAARDAGFRAQIDALHATERAAAERDAAAQRTIAELASASEEMARTHAGEVAAMVLRSDEHQAALQGAFEKVAAERDRMQAEIVRLQEAEAQMTQSAQTLMETVAGLNDSLAAQATTFADDARQSRERERDIEAALHAEIKRREDDHAARQSIVYRMKSVFAAPARPASD